MTETEIRIKIEKELTPAIKGLQELEEQIKKAQKSANSFMETFKGMGIGIDKFVDKVEEAGSKLITSIMKPGKDFANISAKFKTVYKDVEKVANDTMNKLRREYNLSKKAVTDYLGSIGDVLKKYGLSEEAALNLSKQVIKLANDLSALKDIPMSTVIETLTKGLGGEIDAFKSLGITIDEEIAKEKELAKQQLLLKEGFVGTQEELKKTAKLHSILDTVIEQVKDSVNDLGQSVGNKFNNIKKIIEATITDVVVKISSELLPIVKKVETQFKQIFNSDAKQVISTVDELIEGFRKFGKEDLANALSQTLQQAKQDMEDLDFQNLVENLESSIDDLSDKLGSQLLPMAMKAQKQVMEIFNARSREAIETADEIVESFKNIENIKFSDIFSKGLQEIKQEMNGLDFGTISQTLGTSANDLAKQLGSDLLPLAMGTQKELMNLFNMDGGKIINNIDGVVKKFQDFGNMISSGNFDFKKIGEGISEGISFIQNKLNDFYQGQIDNLNQSYEEKKALLQAETEEEADLVEFKQEQEEEEFDRKFGMRQEEFLAMDEKAQKEFINKQSASKQEELLNLKAVKSREARDKEIEKLEKKKSEDEKAIKSKQFEAERGFRIASVIMDLASSIMKLWVSPGFPAAIPMTAVVGGVSAAQIGAIVGQKNPYAYSIGGIATSQQMAMLGEAGPEVILPARLSKMILELSGKYENASQQVDTAPQEHVVNNYQITVNQVDNFDDLARQVRARFGQGVLS